MAAAPSGASGEKEISKRPAGAYDVSPLWSINGRKKGKGKATIVDEILNGEEEFF